MASPQRLSLERSLNQFRRELSDEQQREISGANRKAIDHEIQKMQAKLGREKSLCRLSRIEKFLDAMEHIEKLVTIFLNVSEVVAFIWLVLMAAMAWTNCIKKLLDVYEEIADALDNLAFFQGLIKSDTRLSRVLEDYFSDIVLFHHSILDFFSRPDWKGKFQWAWGDLRRKVKPTIESLKKKQELLSDSKLQPHAILKEIQDSDSYAKEQFKQINSGLEGMIHFEQTRSQKLHEQEIKSFLERKLNVSSSQIASQVQVPDAVIGSSGSWIFHHPLFKSWEADTLPPNCVLFLSGCPGAGKSTLARTIISHYSEKRPQQSLTHFFFKHNDADRRSVRSMFCHIISQIIYKDDVMLRFAYDKCSSVDYLDLPVLKALALDCLSSRRDTTIVLDGLDEGNEPDRAIEWCLGELLSTVSSRGCHVRLLICGQEDGRIEPLLSSYPQIRLHKADPHQKDIEEYCKAQASLIATRFRLHSDDQTELILKVTKASKGMFLYTKVVLANLTSMGSKKEFKAELANDRFPRNLDEAYGRIVQRVINAAEPSAKSSAKKILGLLVCSERPLRWREIQSRFCINADEAICDPDDLRADTCKQLCSSLVDITDCELFPGIKSEQTITMIHETASKYLVHIGVINIMEEHIVMSLFCCRYLSSGPFLAVEGSSIADFVQNGYFSFMDYAAVYHQSHIHKAEFLQKDSGTASQIDAAKEAFSDLEKAYCKNASDCKAKTDPYEETCPNLSLAIQDKVSSIRSFTDTQRDSLFQNTAFQDLEGPKRYKCCRVWCGKFFVGFSSKTALQRHLASHERPFRCIHESCFAHILGYTSRQALQCHIKTFHDEPQSNMKFPTGRRSDRHDRSAFIDACKAGNLSNVKSLHLLGADVLGFSYTTSPLKVAVKAGHAHICKYLIENGAKPLETNTGSSSYESSPLYLAVNKNDLEILEVFLFGNWDIVPGSNVSLLRLFVRDIFTNFTPAVDLLLHFLATGHSSRLFESLQESMLKELVPLFHTWGEVTGYFNGPILVGHSKVAATSLHKRFREIFPGLYDHNGILCLDQDRQEYQICQQAFKLHTHALHDVFLAKHYALAAFLMDLDNGNIFQEQATLGNMPLHVLTLTSCKVSCPGCITMTERLAKLDIGRFGNVPNHEGKLPVHIALERDLFPGLLRVVLNCTYNLNHKDEVGASPLHYVRSEESLSILLQNSNVDLFSRNRQGQTVFAAICQKPLEMNRYGRILVFLLKAESRLAWTADESPQRLTPLHHAMTTGCKDYAVLLLQLPTVEQILKAFLASGVDGSEEVREFARQKGLEVALKMMEVLGFGLPSRHMVDT